MEKYKNIVVHIYKIMSSRMHSRFLGGGHQLSKINETGIINIDEPKINTGLKNIVDKKRSNNKWFWGTAAPQHPPSALGCATEYNGHVHNKMICFLNNYKNLN